MTSKSSTTSALNRKKAVNAVLKMIREDRPKSLSTWTISSDSPGVITDGAILTVSLSLRDGLAEICSVNDTLCVDGALTEESIITRITEDAVASSVNASVERFLRRLALEMEKLKPKEELEEIDGF